MREVVRDAGIGLGLAGAGGLITRYTGFNWLSLTIILYFCVFSAVIAGIRVRLDKNISLLDRLVLVSEEGLEMKKLATGEKYKIKGEVEKI